MAEKVPLEGMNTLEAMVRVNFLDGSPSGYALTAFPRILAQNRINMKWFVGAGSGHGVLATACVADGDGIRVKSLADFTPELQGHTELRGAAALVSIYPHRFSLKTVGLALIALAEAGLPLYGVCSSLSAFTFITDEARLQEVFTAMEAAFDFPNNPPKRAG